METEDLNQGITSFADLTEYISRGGAWLGQWITKQSMIFWFAVILFVILLIIWAKLNSISEAQKAKEDRYRRYI